MNQVILKSRRCFTIVLAALGTLTASIVTWENSFSQDTTFWKREMIKIAKPSSQQGWIDLKEELNVNPKTIFNEYKSAFGISEGIEMRVSKISTDLTGNKHYRYNQYYKGLRVEGGEYIVHEKKGISVGVSGKVIDKLPTDATPAISEQTALNQALSYLNASEYYWQNKKREELLKAKDKNPNATYYPKGELLFAHLDANGKKEANDVLAYRFIIITAKPKNESRLIYVDAKSNKILKDVPLEMNCSPTNVKTNFNGIQQIGTYTGAFTSGFDLEDNCSPTVIKVFDRNNDDDIFNDHDNNWTDPYELSAASSLWAIKRSVDIYGVFFNRNGFDNDGSDLNVIQGFVFGNQGGNNAKYRHFSVGTDEIDVGLGGTSSPYDDYNTLDILGHEFSHGVSNSETNWSGIGGESGALNEAFSDVMGEAIEFYVTGTNDWLNGTGIGWANSPVRSLINPNTISYSDDNGATFKSYPDTYLGNGWEYGSFDNNGVHINAGIMDYAFYLLSQGGSAWNNGQTSHAPAGSGYSYNVSGIGIDKASHIFYNALFFLNHDAQYNDMRNATIHAARDMYGGDCANEVIQLAEAWRAVGVGTQSYLYNHQVCNPITSTYYKASSTVTAGGSCFAGITGTVPVQFEARDAVVLLPGFSVAPGSTFRANISACAVTAFRSPVITKTYNPINNDSQSEKITLNKIKDKKSELQVYPNPTSSIAHLSFSLKNDENKIILEVLDSKMRKVKEMGFNRLTAGKQTIPLNLTNLSSDIYIVVLKLSSEQLTTKVVVTK